MDFDVSWRQVSNDPLVFEAVSDAEIEVEDTSHIQHRLRFRQGGRIKLLRVAGRYRITWDDGDLIG